eukprot:1190221-Prorocentrum_minimum.AAC.6
MGATSLAESRSGSTSGSDRNDVSEALTGSSLSVGSAARRRSSDADTAGMPTELTSSGSAGSNVEAERVDAE